MGRICALNVDVVLPTGVAERVAKKIGGLVAPTIPYGYKSQPRSGGGEAFPGTTSLDANTFSLVVRDVIRGLGHHGVRRHRRAERPFREYAGRRSRASTSACASCAATASPTCR